MQTFDPANALTGALVADAASMGLHWIYDQSHIAAIASSGDVLFRQPDAAHYHEQKAYFAHAGRNAGELSHYGESARLLAELVAQQTYTTDAHRAAFLASFGPCGSFVGYADRPTKALVAKILTEGEQLQDPSGCDDDQLPALCVVPGLFANEVNLDVTQLAVRVLSVNDHAVAAASALYTCLNMIRDGASCHDALVVSAKATGGELGVLMVEALGIEGYQPLVVAEKYGMACHMHQGLPVIWHLLEHASDYTTVVRDNILCGGDSCGRSMAIGAIAGLLYGVPDDLTRRLNRGVLK